MSHDIHAEIFIILKQTLKTRRMTYANLAEKLDVSEPTIKRLFMEQDCKFSRLSKICDILGLALTDILQSAERSQDRLDSLSDKAHTAFARKPSLFHFFMLLRSVKTISDIADLSDISQQEAFLYARDLEKLGLITIGHHNAVTFTQEGFFKLEAHGITQDLYKHSVLQFTEGILNKNITGDAHVSTFVRRMNSSSYAALQAEIDALIEKIRKIARQDSLTSSETDLQSYTWVMASGNLSPADVFKVAPYSA